MKQLLRLIDLISLVGAVVAAILLLAMFTLGLSEIVLRSAFDISLSVVHEYSGYMLAAALFWGSGWTLGQGGHIRVSLIFSKLGPTASRWLDSACTVIALAMASLMTIALMNWAAETARLGEVSYFPSATPLHIPQYFFACGPLILSLALFARAFRLLRNEQVEANPESGSIGALE